MRRASLRSQQILLVCLALWVGTALVLGLSHYIHLNVVKTVVSTLVPGVPALGATVYLAIRSTPGRALSKVADELADRYRDQWEKEVELWQIYDPRALRVSWQAVGEDLVDKGDRMVSEAKEWYGSDPACRAPDRTDLAGSDAGRDLAELLSRVPTGRLVVLGEPGAGKTILLVRLVLYLLEQRKWTPGKPVPVLVSLASWKVKQDERNKKDKQDFRTWLTGRLITDYPELAKSAPSVTGEMNLAGAFTGEMSLAEALLADGLLLPILDGLDELDKSVRRLALRKINRWLKPGRGLIVSCRTDDYREVVNPQEGERVKLRGTAGVMVDPLDDGEVRDYLCPDPDAGRTADRWKLVLDANLGKGTPVGEALRTPLMVSLAHAVYNSPTSDPQDLADLCKKEKFPDLEAVKQQLFRAFIDTAYGPDSPKPCKWPAKKAKRWLIYLACHLETPPKDAKDEGISAVNAKQWLIYNAKQWLIYLVYLARHLKPPPKDTKGERDVDLAWWKLRYAAPRRLSGLAVGIVAGLATGFVAGFGADNGAGIGIGLGLGLLVGLVVRWLVRQRRTRSTGPTAEPTAELNTEPIKLNIEPIQGLVGGLVGGLLGGLVAGLVNVWVIGHGRGLAGGIPIGLGVGMGIGPTSGRRDGLLGGFVGGLVGGFVGTLGWGVGLAAGLLNGLGVGLTAGFSVEFFGRRKPARRVKWDIKSLPGGIAVGSMVGVIAWVISGSTIGIVAGSIAGIVATAAVGLIDVPAGDLEAAGPGAVLARDRRTFIIFGLVVALATGSIGGLTVGLVSAEEKKVEPPSLAFLITNGMGIALATALVLGLSFAFAKSSWGSFTLARCWLALRGDLPWRLMAFLTDAHEQRGVLRQSGAVYQFRHVDLQGHLARQTPRTVPTKSGEAEQDERVVEAAAGSAQPSAMARLRKK